MKRRQASFWLTVIIVLALAVAACEPTVPIRLPSQPTPTTTQVPVDEPGLPGEGVNVIAGRADWSTGYVQSYLYRQLLEELGYTVSDPAELELGPNNAYVAMALGEMDFWPNSWYPGHLAWLAGELPGGSLVGDHVSIVGEEMIAGGLQGFLVTKSFADEFEVYTLDDLNANKNGSLDAFDATDPVPGNGIADIFGCPESWTCDNIITNQIAFSGWENIAQTIAGYDAMFARAVDNANSGVPMVAYTWTPSAYITELRPGDNVYWMGVNAILDDSNPTGQEGGEAHDQRGADGTGGFAAIGADQCPAAADTDDGLCPIGWVAADIQVTANNEFLDANPAARRLFEVVKLSVIDVSLANVEQDAGASPDALATQWIADNRDLVDEWIAEAMAAAATDERVDSIAGRANWTTGNVQTYLYKQFMEWLSTLVDERIAEALAAAIDASVPTTTASPTTTVPRRNVDVVVGRADWSTGYVQSYLYRQLLEELGYTVSDPAELELGPNIAYVAMALGEMDFWPNSWYPGHLAWLAGELPGGSLVGDHVSIVGEEMIAGGLQGYLVTKSFADEFEVYTLDDLNANKNGSLDAFDETDPVPGNGIADIFGCPESWTCDNIITNQIAFSGWENIAQTIAGYDAMFARAVDNANSGVPMVAYTWTPSAYITELRPGDNVYWMGVNAILDDSNPTGQEGGEAHDQRGADGTGGFAAIGADQCPAAADTDDGLCPIGWVAADIQVTANNEFLDANPAARRLFEVVKLSVIDVSLANVEQDAGASPDALATQWIADNRDLVDEWIAEAMAAA